MKYIWNPIVYLFIVIAYIILFAIIFSTGPAVGMIIVVLLLGLAPWVLVLPLCIAGLLID